MDEVIKGLSGAQVLLIGKGIEVPGVTHMGSVSQEWRVYCKEPVSNQAIDLVLKVSPLQNAKGYRPKKIEMKGTYRDLRGKVFGARSGDPSLRFIGHCATVSSGGDASSI